MLPPQRVVAEVLPHLQQIVSATTARVDRSSKQRWHTEYNRFLDDYLGQHDVKFGFGDKNALFYRILIEYQRALLSLCQILKKIILMTKWIFVFGMKLLLCELFLLASFRIPNCD